MCCHITVVQIWPCIVHPHFLDTLSADIVLEFSHSANYILVTPLSSPELYLFPIQFGFNLPFHLMLVVIRTTEILKYTDLVVTFVDLQTSRFITLIQTLLCIICQWWVILVWFVCWHLCISVDLFCIAVPSLRNYRLVFYYLVSCCTVQLIFLLQRSVTAFSSFSSEKGTIWKDWCNVTYILYV